jgi:hypothetical protein
VGWNGGGVLLPPPPPPPQAEKVVSARANISKLDRNIFFII